MRYQCPIDVGFQLIVNLYSFFFFFKLGEYDCDIGLSRMLDGGPLLRHGEKSF